MPTRLERDLDKANNCEDEIRGKDHLGEHGWPMMSRLTANSLRDNQRDKSRDADASRSDFSGTAVSFGSASSFTSLQLRKFAMSVGCDTFFDGCIIRSTQMTRQHRTM